LDYTIKFYTLYSVGNRFKMPSQSKKGKKPVRLLKISGHNRHIEIDTYLQSPKIRKQFGHAGGFLP
jgi:hypothetical protein